MGSREKDSQDVSSPDIGSADIGSADIGSRDIGSADIASQDIGKSYQYGTQRTQTSDIVWDAQVEDLAHRKIKEKKPEEACMQVQQQSATDTLASATATMPNIFFSPLP
jgi:hypothetical protein